MSEFFDIPITPQPSWSQTVSFPEDQKGMAEKWLKGPTGTGASTSHGKAGPPVPVRPR